MLQVRHWEKVYFSHLWKKIWLFKGNGKIAFYHSIISGKSLFLFAIKYIQCKTYHLKHFYIYSPVVAVVHSVMSDSLWLHGLQHARVPCPSPSPGACSNSCPLSQWCHPTISTSVAPFSSCLQSFPASGSFQMSQFFASGSWSIGVSTLTSVLPMNIPDWFPLGLTGLISLQFKGLSRIFSNTMVQKHQFFDAQLSLWSSSSVVSTF